MTLKAGLVLKSTKILADTLFAGTSIIIVEYNEKGAIGYIFNKPSGKFLHELEEFKLVPRFLLYEGGPVDQEHLYFIHQRPDLIEESIYIDENIYWGGNFNQVIDGIKTGKLTKSDIKIFIGYCGWDKGELEGEIKEGSWIIANERTEVFV